MKTVIIVLLAAGILATTNPDSDAFSDHVRDRIHERIEENSNVGSDLGALGAGLTAMLAERVTERKNYLLFSTYKIELDKGNDDGHWKYLGIAGQFFQLAGPDDEEQN